MGPRCVSLGLGLFISLGVANVVPAEDNVTADGIRLGKTLVGPEWTADKLKGQVILVEFWGIN